MENVMEGELPRVSWGPVIAGVVAALAVQVVLGLFGLGFGFASATTDSGALGVIAVIWTLLVAAVASLTGANIAVRIASASQPKAAFLHGALVWCIGLIAGALFLAGSLAGAGIGAGAAVGGRANSLLPSAARPTLETRKERVTREARAEQAEKHAAGGAALGGLAALFGLGGALLGAEIGRRELLGRPWLQRYGGVRFRARESDLGYQRPIGTEGSRPQPTDEAGPRH